MCSNICPSMDELETVSSVMGNSGGCIRKPCSAAIKSVVEIPPAHCVSYLPGLAQ